jgi:hypothetical protein
VISPSEASILKGNPNANAARIWLNWFLSKEGQFAQFVGTNTQPSHKDLQRKESVVFADEVAGKKTAAVGGLQGNASIHAVEPINRVRDRLLDRLTCVVYPFRGET